MQDIQSNIQSESESGMGLVLCTCSECIKVKHTGPSGQLSKGSLVHPGTRSKHRTRMHAEAKNTSVLKALTEDFCTKAQLKNHNAVEDQYETDGVNSSFDPNMIQLFCKIPFHFGIL
ncbi:hypothetical protein CROQUDRAFT_36961 [Cronartium quercuum f. sp. fusiforme G11]|uniref:Uncharacterized protein n=1 Tax=Cronartium quercuum f. sp. fusiforme G11 TaxID=708437 RepID=A0A9P6NTC9_9BASI|nr:hypothetical protein CROQUDRAFT_36961 [Cronartium quercuum f. sp. fusiforme G11]